MFAGVNYILYVNVGIGYSVKVNPPPKFNHLGGPIYLGMYICGQHHVILVFVYLLGQEAHSENK
jgi:hypothetical protein